MNTETKLVRDMTPVEFTRACAEICRPQPRRGIDMQALEQITKGRKATELNLDEYRSALAILRRDHH